MISPFNKPVEEAKSVKADDSFLRSHYKQMHEAIAFHNMQENIRQKFIRNRSKYNPNECSGNGAARRRLKAIERKSKNENNN